MNTRSAPSTILVVDDEPHVVHVLSVVLRHVGYRVLAASDVEEAISVLSTHGADLVITDPQMSSHDGASFASRLFRDERSRGIPIVFLTGHGEGTHGRLAPNVRLVLGKPFSPRHIVEEISKLLPSVAASRSQAA
ncbi:MAG: response regulator [Phycisphaerales bacterium]